MKMRMKIKLDGDYGTREHPHQRVTIYCIDAPGCYSVNGRSGIGVGEWTEYGQADYYSSNDDLVPLQRIRLTQLAVNWNYIAEKWTCVARNKDGSICVHSREPKMHDGLWTTGVVGTTAAADVLAGVHPGTCDWKDSLVRRPNED
jgi:hypothetical protein